MTFEKVCMLDELTVGAAAAAEVGGRRVAIVRDEAGHVHAVEDECTHGAVPLSEGEVIGCTLECWLHGSRFDLVTGEPKSLPARAAVAVYAVRIDEGAVFVDPTPTNF